MMDFALKAMDFALKMLIFCTGLSAIKQSSRGYTILSMNVSFKPMNFVFKMMNLGRLTESLVDSDTADGSTLKSIKGAN